MIENPATCSKIFNCAGKTLDLSTPAVMGILNITDDSFFDGGSYVTTDAQLRQAEKMVGDGASIIDIGAVSTRPGIKVSSEEEEEKRLIPALKSLISHFPDVIFSIDTFRTEIASATFNEGAGMINDIYGGTYDSGMIPFVVSRNLPYILMHMQGTPENMQAHP
ncbi:MAG: dihydropteroate synthase, partial [Bacteroidota bacterium]|nr:dihydropteroate synthase [Bacteroidota bacterium]